MILKLKLIKHVSLFSAFNIEIEKLFSSNDFFSQIRGVNYSFVRNLSKLESVLKFDVYF